MGKSLIYFTLAFICCCSTAVSQVYSDKETANVSFTAGITSSNMYNDSLSYRPGILFNGGFIYNLSFNEHLGVGVEALLSGKAYKLSSPIIRYRFYYVDVPLYMQWKINDDIRINAGGQFSKYLSSAEVRTDTASTSGTKAYKYRNLLDTDISVLAGLEIDISKNLALAARYTTSTTVFGNSDKVGFGVFQFSFKYTVWRSYKQFFAKEPPSQG